MTRIEAVVLRLMAPPASYAPDSARNDMVAVAWAIGVLLVIAFLCSWLPGVAS